MMAFVMKIMSGVTCDADGCQEEFMVPGDYSNQTFIVYALAEDCGWHYVDDQNSPYWDNIFCPKCNQALEVERRRNDARKTQTH